MMEWSNVMNAEWNPMCNICKRGVNVNENTMYGRLGLLDQCNHVYCLDCIRHVRSQFQLRNSPPVPGLRCDDYAYLKFFCLVCGIPSSYIMSSYKNILDYGTKKMYFEFFRTNLKEIPCPWIQMGQGVCMYPENCLAKTVLLFRSQALSPEPYAFMTDSPPESTASASTSVSSIQPNIH